MKTSTTIPVAMMAAAASSQVPTSAAAAKKTSASDSDHHKKMKKLMKEKNAGLDIGILGGERRLGKSSKTQVGCNASGGKSGKSGGGGFAELTVFNIVPDESNNIAQSDPFLSPYLTTGYDASGSRLTIEPIGCETYFAKFFSRGGPLCQLADDKGLDPELCYGVAEHRMIGTKNVATGALEFTGYFSSVKWGTFDSATVPGQSDPAISTNTTDYLPAKLTVYFDGTYDDANGIKRQKLTSTFSFTADVIGPLTNNDETSVTVAASQKWKEKIFRDGN